VSEESEEEKRKGAAGGSFEQGMRSALDQAPGLAAPSWLTMQSAMAGGAAGGAAAASWRWIIGPAAGAALIGGALWWSQPSEEPLPDPESTEIVTSPSSDDQGGDFEEKKGGLGSDVTPAEEQASGQLVVESKASEAGEITTSAEKRDGNRTSRRSSSSETSSRSNAAAAITEPVEVPEDWAELPAEKAASFAVDIESTCVGTEIGFRMAKPMKDVRVLWNFGDGQFSNLTEPQHVFKAPGTYDITLSITRISDGLIRTRTIENLVTIHPNPVADFTWQVPSTAEASPTIEMRDRSRDAVSATWIIDGESSQVGGTAKFELAKVGEHVVQLVAGSPHGCQSVASHVVEVGNRFGLGGAARFSPDGDGRYDTFLPRKLILEEAPFVFRVEDAEGHIVHETTGPRAWDGRLPDGRTAAAGSSFAWAVIVQRKDGPSYFSDAVQIE
jgi:hypothetical protein